MGTRIELDQVTGSEEWAGWVIVDGTMHAPDTWRRGFTPHDIRSWFFTTQQVRSLQYDLKRLDAELQQALNEKAALEQRAAFYRRQCVLEARLGLALSAFAR